jgi:hypothetical protein
MGHIHAARLSSPRLQRVLQLMADGKRRSTRSIVRGAKVMAVNAVMTELRHHGAVITCVQEPNPRGRGRVWFYQMLQPPIEKAPDET